ncbi:hypothetical protein C8Q77DRAFT_1098566 [Trametes polyzona]|nr:hypothetical protein C8Q77DRAFT_1098566 [Trametes polyzona]
MLRNDGRAESAEHRPWGIERCPAHPANTTVTAVASVLLPPRRPQGMMVDRTRSAKHPTSASGETKPVTAVQHPRERERSHGEIKMYPYRIKTFAARCWPRAHERASR